GLHQGLRRARHCHAGGGRRHGERLGQMFNAFKEQTPLVVYSYRTDQTRRAGRDGFEEVANQEQMVQPITKYTWLARRTDMIPETVRRGFKAAWTPPYGPAYISWHSDYNDERVRTEIIAQELVDPRMRVRPNPDEIQRGREAPGRGPHAAHGRGRRN